MARAVAPTETISEFIKPRNGLKLLPSSSFRLSKKWVEGSSATACCWISTVERVAFTSMIQKGITLSNARKMHTT